MTKRPRRNHSPTFKAKTPIRSTSQPVAQHPAGGIKSVENHLEIGTTLFKKNRAASEPSSKPGAVQRRQDWAL